MKHRVLKGALCAVALMVGGQTASSIAQEAPPSAIELKPDERIEPYANGCARVLHTPFSGETLRLVLESERKTQWRGECRLGLAHGRGREIKPGILDEPLTMDRDFSYGRASPYRNSLVVSSGSTGPLESETYASDGPAALKSVTVFGSLDNPTPFANPGSAHSALLNVSRGGVFTQFTLTRFCYEQMVGDFVEADRARARRVCRGGDAVHSIGVNVTRNGASRLERRLCSDPRSAGSCRALYTELIAPFRSELEAVIRDAPALHAAWMAQQTEAFRPAEAAERTRRAQAAQAEAERVAAIAQAQAESDAAFRDSLQTASAGALFSQADRLREAGDTARARETLRALIERFPDHALAATAAQQLAGTSSGASGGSTAAAPQSAAGASGQCAGTPDQELKAWDSGMAQWAQQNPPPSSAGAQAQYIWTIKFANEGLRRLEPRRICMGPNYEPNRKMMADARTTAIRGCQQLSTAGEGAPECRG